mmetsp:Transcript_12854/g.45551  ORF Transcript_12854/g.45551 Transcript_12854/m.45551 type:complete len:702 (-) Transcript_12854:286-2391(-)
MAKSMLTFTAGAALVHELGASHAFISEPIPSTPAVHHFRHYAGREERIAYDGNLEGAFAGQGFHPRVGSFEELVVKVNQHTDRQCGGGQLAWTLVSAAYDGEGAQHAVLRTLEGLWQYVALQDEQLLVADPPLCAQRGRAPSIAAAAERWRRRRLQSSSDHIDEAALVEELGEPTTTAGGKEDLLEPSTDHLVQDCARTFNYVAKDYCGESANIQLWGVTVGKLQVIDGFVVRLHGDVRDGKGNENTNRIVECTYEQPQYQGEHRHMEWEPAAHEIDFERLGLIARVRMYVDICQAANVTIPDPTSLAILGLFDTKSLGELSRYRGHRHVYENVTRFFDLNGIMQLESMPALPSSVSLRALYPKCFPSFGKDIVRNQGSCGSCWAFSSASAMMNNLCIAGANEQTMASAYQRYEVSVQRLMTCNPEGMGCGGGHALAAWQAMKTGIARERDAPYLCSGGDPQSHFTVKSTSCDAFPWGDDSTSTCAAELAQPGWIFDGLYKVSGEHEMMNALVSGYTLFITVDMTEGLQYYNSPDVYQPGVGSHIIGGHGMVSTGYGSYGGAPFWWVQNSWGPDWNEGGFVKITRGINALGIEEGAMVFRGWPVGSEASMSPPVGLREHGNPLLNELEPLLKELRTLESLLDKLQPLADKIGTDTTTLAEGIGGLFVSAVIFFSIRRMCCGSEPQTYQQYQQCPPPYPPKY